MRKASTLSHRERVSAEGRRVRGCGARKFRAQQSPHPVAPATTLSLWERVCAAARRCSAGSSASSCRSRGRADAARRTCLFRRPWLRRRLAEPHRQRAAGRDPHHRAAPPRRRRADDDDRRRRRVARDHVPFPGKANLRLGAAPAACGPDLHYRLRLSRRDASDRAGADDAETSPGNRAPARSLVPGDTLAPRLHLPARRRALSVCLSAGARALSDAVGDDAGGGADARREPAPRLPARCRAACAPGDRGRREPRADGGAERHRRLGVPRHPHADCCGLHDLGRQDERRGRGADRARHARGRVRAGAD